MRATCIIIVLLCVCRLGYAQTDAQKQLANDKVDIAMRMEDNGQADTALILLRQAVKLDPANVDYKYELAYAYSMKKQFNTVIKLIDSIINNPGINYRYYELLGNSYDFLDKTDSARDAYKKGLAHFPNAGGLYYELGVLAVSSNQFDTAVAYFEKGIQAEPTYASNYYSAANIYFHSDHAVWGMLYGEIFMNLERNTQRTQDMSKALYMMYRNQIPFKGDTLLNVAFCKSDVDSLKALKSKKEKLSYAYGVYKMTMAASVAGEKSITAGSIDTIRTRFIDAYYKKGYDKKYPNVLFGYQHVMEQLGYLDAYNHWVILKGDEQAFAEWYKSNRDKWLAFEKWFSTHTMVVNSSNYFVSTQYQ